MNPPNEGREKVIKRVSFLYFDSKQEMVHPMLRVDELQKPQLLIVIKSMKIDTSRWALILF
jgi:hypothetical protein